MKIYADSPVRRSRQVTADVWMVVWVVVWIRIGVWIDDLVMKLAVPGRKLAEAGTGLEDGLTDAGEKVGGIPLAGDRLQGTFDQASGAGGSLRSAGTAQVEAVDRLATILGVVIAVIPIALLLIHWFPRRYRFARQASSAQRFIDAAPDLDLFALRALANQPMTELARISADPAGDWRSREPAVVRALATLELRAAGLRPPPLDA